jgi:GGDEF domain-containing protein
MHPEPPRPRRARPVVDLPLDALLERREDLTKAWLLALIEAAPLEQAEAILAAGLVRDGPRLCEGILLALMDDPELRALDRGGQIGRLVFQAGELAGATDVEGASRAIDALGAVIWAGVLQVLRDPDADQMIRLAERLAAVLGEVRVAAIRRYSSAPARPAQVPPTFPVRPVAPCPPEEQTPPEEPAPPAERTPPPATPAAPVAAAGPGAGSNRTSGGDPTGPPPEPVRDELWVRALDEEIVRSQHAGMSLALLLVELEEAERMRSVESGGALGTSFGRFAQAMRSTLRRRDILACETDTRAWIVAKDTMRPGAQALGGRIAGAVQAAEPWRGAPLTVSVGVAVLGEDGRDRDALMGAAEQDRFAASASGTAVLRGLGPDPEGEGPPEGWAG